MTVGDRMSAPSRPSAQECLVVGNSGARVISTQSVNPCSILHSFTAKLSFVLLTSDTLPPWTNVSHKGGHLFPSFFPATDHSLEAGLDCRLRDVRLTHQIVRE